MNSATMTHADEDRAAEIGARIDRLPAWGLTLAGKAVFAAAYFFSFYDIIAIGATLPNIAHALHLSGAEEALPLTTSLIGYIIGAVILGHLADSWGRRNTLLVTMLLLAASSVLCGLSWNIASLAVFRLFNGMGIGAQISLSATMINELSPSAQRGRNIQRNIIAGGIGDAVTPFVAMALLATGDFGWRLVLGFGVLALIPAALLYWLPESPRWLAAKGRYDEAQRVVSEMEATLQARGVVITNVHKAAEVALPASAMSVSFVDLFRPPYLSRVLVVTTYWTLFYVATYGFLGFETVLLDKMTIQQPHGLLFTALGDLAFPVGAALPLILLDRIPRRYLLGLSSITYTVGLAVLAASWNGAVMVLGAVLVALNILFNCGVGYIYTSEIFPTRVRASAMGIADGGGHIGGMIAPYVVLAAMASWGARGAFGFLAGLMVICAILIVTLGVRRTDELPSV
ncbi:MFS transporter [Acidiphilium sp. AL]|uniref:MFS transporter n=1 Tax=Acidiphilium sp. AL TaxID=2871704 RepID=UPI0021CB77D8|nr:MFS transporter [Acidiphilium sp. AL]MCU4158931.1 MFS transporter [Acidiphilium sp. AL]